MTTDISPRTSSTTLARLLDEELAFSPSFRRHYSNHLAMVLAALDQMGARPGVLQATFDAHARSESEPRGDVAALDQRRREVASDGIAATVRARVPALAPGPHSQLFHPMIRLAYALDVGHEGQVAAALLDWESRHQVLPIPEPTPGTRRLPDVAADLAAHPPGTWPRTFDLDGIARRAELSAALTDVALDDATLDDISTFAIAAHAVADDFITLHMVTGARAVRAVSAWVDQDTAQRLIAHTVPAMGVAYSAVGAPALLGPGELDALRRTALPSRETIAEQAIRNHDPHVVKLVNVALVEEDRTGDLLYRHSAARVVGLL